jgi:predicted RNA-binding Zn-ribbon protein involved in translation (DUF1610 family)
MFGDKKWNTTKFKCNKCGEVLERTQLSCSIATFQSYGRGYWCPSCILVMLKDRVGQMEEIK